MFTHYFWSFSFCGFKIIKDNKEIMSEMSWLIAFNDNLSVAQPADYPCQTFCHFKASAVITTLWGVPDPRNQRLLETPSLSHMHARRTDICTVHTQANMLRQIALAITRLKLYHGKKEVGYVGNFAYTQEGTPLISTPPPSSFLPLPFSVSPAIVFLE